MRRIGYFEAGDAVRGWGVLAVILGHCATAALFAEALRGDPAQLQVQFAANDVGWENLFDNHQVGAAIASVQLTVYLFFGLSSYLLARPYIAAALGQVRRAPPIGRYVKHRLGRVVPVFWFMIVVTMVQFGTDGTTAIDMVATFLFGQYWTSAPFNVHLTQAWTLNIEAHFYVALPIVAAAGMWIYARGGRLRGPLSFVPMLVVCTAAYLLATTWLPATTVPSQSPLGGLIVFVPGVLIALVEAKWGHRLKALPWLPIASVVMVVAGLALTYKQFSLAAPGSIAERNYLTIAAGLILAALIFWQASERPTWAFMRWRWVHWIGERSFSIYISHGAILYEVRDFGVGQPTSGRHMLLLLVIMVPLALLVGEILYRLVERPMIRLSRSERPLFRDGPVVRKGSAPPTIGTTPAPVPVPASESGGAEIVLGDPTPAPVAPPEADPTRPADPAREAGR